MLTPFAPWISVTTPWAETEAARAAIIANCEIYMIDDYGFEVNSSSGEERYCNKIMRKRQAEEKGKKR
jgi:hypothetical protein